MSCRGSLVGKTAYYRCWNLEVTHVGSYRVLGDIACDKVPVRNSPENYINFEIQRAERLELDHLAAFRSSYYSDQSGSSSPEQRCSHNTVLATCVGLLVDRVDAWNPYSVLSYSSLQLAPCWSCTASKTMECPLLFPSRTFLCLGGHAIQCTQSYVQQVITSVRSNDNGKASLKMLVEWYRDLCQTVCTGRLNKSWCVFQRRNRSTIPASQKQIIRRWTVRPNQRARDARTIGGEAINLLRDLLSLHADEQDLQLRVQAINEARSEAETLLDSSQCILIRGRTFHNVDLAREIAFVEEQIPVREQQAREHRITQRALGKELADTKQRSSDLWSRLFIIAQLYTNNSFDVDFQSEWSLPHNVYVSLRFCLDQYTLIQNNETKLRELKLDLITTRTRQWKGGKQITDGPAILPEGISQELERQRGLDYQREMQLCQEMIDDLRDIMFLQQKNLEMLYAELMGGNFGPNLGRPASGTGVPGSTGDERASPAASESSEEPDLGQFSPGTLQDAYMNWRDELERLQGVLAESRRIYRRDEADHLLTFTNSNRARYERYVLLQLRPDIAAINTAEAKLVDLAIELDAAGWEVPATPEPAGPFQPPVGGGIRDRRSDSGPSDASRSESILSRMSGMSGRRVSPTTRRRFNLWRFGAAGAGRSF